MHAFVRGHEHSPFLASTADVACEQLTYRVANKYTWVGAGCCVGVQTKKFESLGFTRAQAEDMTQHLTEQIILDRQRLSEKFSAKVELEKVRERERGCCNCSRHCLHVHHTPPAIAQAASSHVQQHRDFVGTCTCLSPVQALTWPL